MRSEKDRMLSGESYRPDDPQLVQARARAAAWMARYNAAAAPSPERLALLREAFGAAGDRAEVRPPFYCDYGFNIRLGARAFLNFGCVVLDVGPVEIGEMTKIGPAVQILAADHPRAPHERRQGLELGRPVRISANVWIGAGALILPGVEIGDDAIIGAGAVVTRSVAPGATVAGNPARPVARR